MTGSRGWSARRSWRARGHLSDAQYGRLLADGGLDGRLAKVVWTVGSGKLAYDAIIARITAEIRPETGGVTFYALLAADGLDLPIRPGAFVSIELPDRRFPDSIPHPFRGAATRTMSLSSGLMTGWSVAR